MHESIDVQELFGAHYELPELGKFKQWKFQQDVLTCVRRPWRKWAGSRARL